MTDTKTTATSAKQPSHIAYHVRNREGKDSLWTRIGAAWPHADAKGFNIQIDCVPLDGRISIRLPSDKKD